MKLTSLLHLIQPFAIIQIAYVAAFHSWRKQEQDRINATIRKVYEIALGLLQSASTERLLALGVHNPLHEIAEAQRIAQIERLSATRTGRYILQRAALTPSSEPELMNESLADTLRQHLNMHPEHNRERRLTRAKTLIDLHARDNEAVYVDAAHLQQNIYVTATMPATTGVPE